MTRWLLVLLLCGCTAIDSSTRVERGPLLKTFERGQVLEGGATADVRAEWPLLKLTVAGYDVCRSETVDEYAEDEIEEKSSRASGPALSLGMVGTAAGIGLLIASFFVNSAPDTSTIDAAGRYGGSAQQHVQLAGVISGAVGLPALVVGLITQFGAKDETRTTRVEEVVGQRDARCNERPVTGEIELLTDEGGAVTLAVHDGAVDVDGLQMPVMPISMRFAGQEVELDEGGRAAFDAWAACVALRLEPDALLELRAQWLHACKVLRGEELAAQVEEADTSLALRTQLQPQDDAWQPALNVSSWEEAVEAYAPALLLADGSKDLAVLDSPDESQGRAVLLKGVVASGISENIGVIAVGQRQVLLFIPPRRAFDGNFPEGTRVEAVALLAGSQTLGEATLPLLRAVWLRQAW